MLLQIGNIKFADISDCRAPEPERGRMMSQVGVADVCFRRGVERSIFPLGTKLHVVDVDKGRAGTVGVVDYPVQVGAREVWRLPGNVTPGVYDLSKQPKYYRVKNTVQQAMIGREVKWISAQVTTEQIDRHYWHLAGSAWSPLVCSVFAHQVDDWAANMRYSTVTLSSWTNVGALVTIDGMAMVVSASTTWMSELTVNFTVANGETVDFYWTHYIYGDHTELDTYAYNMLDYLFQAPQVTEIPVDMCVVGDAGGPTGISSDNVALSIDPATGNLDGNWDDTYTDWYNAGVLNDTGADKTCTYLRCLPTGLGTRINPTFSPSIVWGDNETRRVEVRVTWSEKSLP